MFNKNKELKKENLLLLEKNQELLKELKNLRNEIYNLENTFIEKDKEISKKEKSINILNKFKIFTSDFLCKFLNEEIIEENYEKLYNYLQIYDKDGFLYLGQIKKETNISSSEFYSNYYYEDNCGYFEEMDGYNFSKYYLQMKFGEIINSTFIGMYEKCEYSDDFYSNDDYKKFIKKVKINTIKDIIKSLNH